MLIRVEAACNAFQDDIRASLVSSSANSATLDASRKIQVLKAARFVHPVRINHIQEPRRAEPALAAVGLPEVQGHANSVTKGIMHKLVPRHAPSVNPATSQA